MKNKCHYRCASLFKLMCHMSKTCYALPPHTHGFFYYTSLYILQG